VLETSCVSLERGEPPPLHDKLEMLKAKVREGPTPWGGPLDPREYV